MDFFCHAAKKIQHISKLDSVQSGHVNLGYIVILEDLCMLAKSHDCLSCLCLLACALTEEKRRTPGPLLIYLDWFSSTRWLGICQVANHLVIGLLGMWRATFCV